jgi:hypothetical protein
MTVFVGEFNTDLSELADYSIQTPETDNSAEHRLAEEPADTQPKAGEKVANNPIATASQHTKSVAENPQQNIAASACQRSKENAWGGGVIVSEAPTSCAKAILSREVAAKVRQLLDKDQHSALNVVSTVRVVKCLGPKSLAKKSAKAVAQAVLEERKGA